MILRDSFRLLTSKFSLVWKNCIWILATLVFGGLLGYFICMPIINAFVEAEIIKNLTDVVAGSMTTSFQIGFLTVIDQIIKAFEIIFSDFNSFGASFILGTLLFVFIFAIINSIRDLATTETLRGHMTSLSKFSFVGSAISKIGVGVLQGLLKIILFIPFLAIYCAICYLGYILVQTQGFIYAISPFIILLLFAFVLALQVTVFSCWTPVIVMHKISASKSMGKGLNAVSTRFWRTLSDAVVFVLLAFVINYAFAKFSFCVTLIITLPATIVLFCIFQMIVYFSTMGQRYYIDSQLIITSQKVEMHDKPQKNKYLI